MGMPGVLVAVARGPITFGDGLRQAVPAVLLIAGVAVLAGTAFAAWLGTRAALGTPADRAAANQMLQLTAVLLGGRLRDRLDYPWHRRPAQYGTIEGDLCGLEYELYLMPRNAEDCGGAAMLQIRPQPGRPLPGKERGLRVFTPEQAWHWPDLADPGTLADFVRQAIAAVNSDDMPPGSS